MSETQSQVVESTPDEPEDSNLRTEKCDTGDSHQSEKDGLLSGLAANEEDVCQDKNISKRAQKRLKRQEHWLAVKALKRKEEKLKKKRKFAEAKERGDNLGPSRKALKKNAMQNSNCTIRVALDCSFDEYMGDKDVRHLVQQIQHSYSANRRADNPLQFYVCGVNGKTQTRLEGIGDYKGWDVYFRPEVYSDVFKKADIVYLSSDSPNILHSLEEDKVYIIGGLVDHNHHKGLCHKLAEEKGVSHAQLPISEYIDMKTRKVLTINHVFEILLQYTESRDWQEAFFKVLPQRKGLMARENKDDTKTAEQSSGAQPDKGDNSTTNNKESVDKLSVSDLPGEGENGASRDLCVASDSKTALGTESDESKHSDGHVENCRSSEEQSVGAGTKNEEIALTNSEQKCLSRGNSS